MSSPTSGATSTRHLLPPPPWFHSPEIEVGPAGRCLNRAALPALLGRSRPERERNGPAIIDGGSSPPIDGELNVWSDYMETGTLGPSVVNLSSKIGWARFT